MIGQTLSHYRITAALGAGGMGEVYRATDSTLNRDVAIKVLPSEVAQDGERLARFRREAQVLASLNHANIAAIYGLEEAEGHLFLVLELVEGENLQERLERGAIRADEALGIAKQMAAALEEAHLKGIVHRDLKPANVKLTPEGQVKVLDFGLAKAWGHDPISGGFSTDLSQSPTLAQTGTMAGMILGTAAYMSPEQASGKPVDKRADVWSFGVVLFEMLSGQRLFTGETVSEILAAVMRDDPDWSKLPGSTPSPIRRLLRRCLQRAPQDRLHDIADARLELDDALAGSDEEAVHSEGVAASTSADRRRHALPQWVWVAAALLIGVLAGGSIVARLAKAPKAPQAVHFVLDAPEGFTWGPSVSFRTGFRDIPSVSPDGRHVAFTGTVEGTNHLWVRSLDSPEARRLEGTADAGLAFWSPDSTWIAFFAGSDLSRVRLDGGNIHRICALPQGSPVGGTWGTDGTIVFSDGGTRGSLFAIAADGGDVRPLTTPDESRGETGHRWPRFFPGERQFLFVVDGPQDGSGGVYVATLDTPHEKLRLTPGDIRTAYTSGHLLSVQGTTLLAQPFDTERLEVSGEPVPIALNVASWAPNPDWGYFGVSPSGVVAFVDGEQSESQLVWVDRKGGRLATVGEPGPYGQIALSPDGRRVALEVVGDAGVDLWIMDVSRGVATRVTAEPGGETDPIWSPDGQDLVFASSAADTTDLFRKDLRGGTPAAPLLESPPRDFWPEDWSRDGMTILYSKGTSAFWALPLAGDGPPELVLETGFRLDEPQLSPDGRWLAYVSEESGDWEVYVQPFRRPGERLRVSVDGGGQPKWRGDGQELFYRSAGGPLVAVAVRGGDERIEVGLPTELFEVGVARRPQVDDYAVTADGQRFLVKMPIKGGNDASIHVVVNWPSLLE